MPNVNSRQAREKLATKPDKYTAVDQMHPAADADPTGNQPAGYESLHAMHSPGGKHMHVSKDEMGTYMTSHVGEDGEPQGPHEHPDSAAVHAHMQQVMDDEGAEAYPDDEQSEGESPMSAPAHHGAY
jgi:hypothetical protein